MKRKNLPAAFVAILSAPDANDEEHGDEGEFEEEIEDEDVFGAEDAEHAGVEEEHPGVVNSEFRGSLM